MNIKPPKHRFGLSLCLGLAIIPQNAIQEEWTNWVNHACVHACLYAALIWVMDLSILDSVLWSLLELLTELNLENYNNNYNNKCFIFYSEKIDYCTGFIINYLLNLGMLPLVLNCQVPWYNFRLACCHCLQILLELQIPGKSDWHTATVQIIRKVRKLDFRNTNFQVPEKLGIAFIIDLEAKSL